MGKVKNKRGRPSSKNMGNSQLISYVARVFVILETLAESGTTSLEQLVNRTGIPKSTIFRLLKTLNNLGYVIRGDDAKFTLSLKMFNIGAKVLESMDLYNVARPIMQRLSDISEETIHLAVMMEDKALYIMKIESRHTIRMYSTIGKEAPLYCTALGKALLAWNANYEEIARRINLISYTEHTINTVDGLLSELELTRKRGYSIDAEEHEPNIYCIGAPIFDYTQQVIAALSISWPVFRFDVNKEKEWANILMDAAKEISILLGYYYRSSVN